MAGPKRWPPLLIPQLPHAWVRAGLVVTVTGSILMARNSLPAQCGFGDEVCHPLLGALGALTTAVFWFWLLAPCVFFCLGVLHITRVTISWLRLDVLRPRRA